MDAKSSKSRRFYYSMSLASCSVPVLQRILALLPPPVQIRQWIWTPPRPNLPANMDTTTPPPPSNFPFEQRYICIIILFLGGEIRGGSFFPPTSGSRDLRNCFASQISHAKHRLFPGSSEKIPVSDGNDRQLLCWAHSRTRTQKSFNCCALSDF